MEMTWRERLADWISGGAVSRALISAYEWRNRSAARSGKLVAKDRALSEIIALETPNMAHVGKKAVAIARKGLGE